jgi:hypothetical protein
MASISNPTPLSSAGGRKSYPLNDVAVLLNPADDVVIAKQPLLPRTKLQRPEGDITVVQMITPGHKIAIHDITQGNPVRRYGQIIGFASADIHAGQLVHSHNVEVHQGELKLDYGFMEDYQPVEYVPEAERRTFMGFRRKDGRIGTRNYVAVLATVNCSSTATRRIAEHFRDRKSWRNTRTSMVSSPSRPRVAAARTMVPSISAPCNGRWPELSIIPMSQPT